MTDTEKPAPRFRLSQETIAIVTVGIALAGLNLATVADLRDEARADRAAAQAATQAAQAAAQAAQAAWQAESRQLRDEARADREHFQREILRLTGKTEKLAAVVEAKE